MDNQPCQDFTILIPPSKIHLQVRVVTLIPMSLAEDGCYNLPSLLDEKPI